MQLCGVSMSPFFERVMIGLDIKGAINDVDYPGVPGGFKSADHLETNPSGKIPYLIRTDGKSMGESQVILEYLDQKLEGPKLVPASPEVAADAKVVCRVFDDEVMPAMWPFLKSLNWGITDEDAIRTAKEERLPRGLDCLEFYMGEGKRAVSDEWTVADCALIPFVFQAQNFLSRFEITDLGNRPKLNAWMERVSETDIFERSMQRIRTSIKEVMAARKAGEVSKTA
ncbi:glutathione S-transferase family protein [Yunchengibacter salinarum]|uniref:glutathione S-transferase family protein n=1 Tax=Yunchengibacter salinarum TaxID=3133399 RepID=UPI0035B5D87A